MSTIFVNDAALDASDAPAHESLLGFLRETAGLTGTKEGCASGDCGACTVILRNPDGSNPINLNSCITPVGAALEKQVVTVEGVGTPEQMHPVQQAMVDHHGSQCGFCTPGFIVSLVAGQLRAAGSEQETETETEKDRAIEAISGNLCRCTGYRPIIDAALAANLAVAEGAPAPLPTAPLPTAPVATTPLPIKPVAQTTQQPTLNSERNGRASAASNTSYARPTSIIELRELLKPHGFTRTLGAPSAAASDADHNRSWLVAGATDAFLEVSQRYLDPLSIADLTQVAELQSIHHDEGFITLGAAVTHSEALTYFSQPEVRCDAIVDVLRRFGSPQVRNRGTLGGNIANASPIADWPPLLIALDTELTLVSLAGKERTLRLDEFYLDYKKTQLAADELILNIRIPADTSLGALHAHKISKRFEDDISSVLAAAYIEVENNRVTLCRIAYGGVAATPLRCVATEAVLTNQPLTQALIEKAANELAQEISPITDVRASRDYRREAGAAVLRNILRKLMSGPALNQSPTQAKGSGESPA